MEIEPLKQAALAELKAAADLAALEQAKGAWLGPHGKFTALDEATRRVCPRKNDPPPASLSTRPRPSLETALADRRSELELKSALPKEPTDFTLPGRRRALGKLHPLTQVTEDIVRSFRKLGFAVADGPEIEDEYHCFDALNTPADHPARDAQDTFYLTSERKGAARAPTPRRCKSGSWKSSRRRCASSCRAAFIAGTIPTPPTTRPSSRSRVFTWTAA